MAAAGLLEGKRATTHWAHTEELAARHPGIEVDPDVLYVDNGSVLTSAGKAATRTSARASGAATSGR
ncbi:Transcriptional regulator, AraC family [Streptomyces xiamenensis]|uniref:Transcriptional regulator, AraC family n=1 Tax=Streptomyces xiamenensis TaxID=408015 RepID=A0A0F7FYC6_9ACTN|nr:Transcriptional regulator, AraC family [Streptomyces xiamenensis]